MISLDTTLNVKQKKDKIVSYPKLKNCFIGDKFILSGEKRRRYYIANYYDEEGSVYKTCMHDLVTNELLYDMESSPIKSNKIREDDSCITIGIVLPVGYLVKDRSNYKIAKRHKFALRSGDKVEKIYPYTTYKYSITNKMPKHLHTIANIIGSDLIGYEYYEEIDNTPDRTPSMFRSHITTINIKDTVSFDIYLIDIKRVHSLKNVKYRALIQCKYNAKQPVNSLSATYFIKEEHLGYLDKLIYKGEAILTTDDVFSFIQDNEQIFDYYLEVNSLPFEASYIETMADSSVQYKFSFTDKCYNPGKIALTCENEIDTLSYIVHRKVLTNELLDMTKVYADNYSNRSIKISDISTVETTDKIFDTSRIQEVNGVDYALYSDIFKDKLYSDISEKVNSSIQFLLKLGNPKNTILMSIYKRILDK